MEHKKLILQQEKFYFSLKPIFCSVLNENVYFTSDGWKHLLYKPNRKKRNVSEQYLKLNCLNYAPTVIKNCKGIYKQITEEIHKKITVYSIVCEVKEGIKIRVILQKIGAGKVTFRSVMPHDKESRINNNKKRQNGV
jgi:hypothetical protein